MKMNIPNTLTVFRVLLIPVFIVLYFLNFTGHAVAAVGVFVVACVTDFLDGYIARKHDLVTNFGKFMDPIADKILVACTLIAVCITEPVVEHAWIFKLITAVFTMLILSRELMISVFRIVAADKDIVLAADMLGKIKTTVQMAALIALLPVTDIFVWHELTGTVFYYSGFALLGLATVLTVVSGVHYIVKNKRVLED